MGARRIDGGERLRAAMRAAGLKIMQVAERTREVDDADLGISGQLLGFLHSAGESGRDTCSHRSAELIESALGAPHGTLFDYE